MKENGCCLIENILKLSNNLKKKYNSPSLRLKNKNILNNLIKERFNY